MAEGEVGFHNLDSSVLGKKQVNSGKSAESSQSRLRQPPKQPKLKCPQCLSDRLYKDGMRYLSDGGVVQRWLCRNCGYRFSEKPLQPLQNNSKQSLNSYCAVVTGYRLSAILQEAKKLDYTTETKTVVGDKTKLAIDNPTIKGKLLEYEFWMQKQNLSPETIRLNRTCLKMLTLNGADLLDPESTKAALIRYKVSESRKRNAITAYTQFLKLNNMTWEKPKCKVTRKFPFIPLEKELDALIAASGKKNAAFLQLLKETAMRSGEAKRLLWTDIDTEKNIIILNNPEKGSNPRMWKVTSKLLGMLSLLPKKSQRVFGDGPINSQKSTLTKTRKALAIKLANPRLLKISFHTFRHWKATQLYHETKDPYYVKDFLGHKELRNTEIYINIERTIFEASGDGFTVKVSENPGEIKSLLEVGFEYVCQKDNLIFLRKRK